MTLREAWKLGKDKLTEAQVPDADLDAWYLLEWCTGVNRSHYLAWAGRSHFSGTGRKVPTDA